MYSVPKSISAKAKTRGRPATDRDDPVVEIRLPAVLVARIETWASDQPDKPSGLEATRRLVEQALAASQPLSQRSPTAVSKASELAGLQIDKLADSSATDAEQHRRKR